MSDIFENLKAAASEHGAVTAIWLQDEATPAAPVFMRCFENDDTVRLVIDWDAETSRQLIIDPARLRLILDDPMPM